MRTKPVAFDEVTKDSPLHLILVDGDQQANEPFLNPKPEDWVAVRDHTTHGWGSIGYLNATAARYEWVHTGSLDVIELTFLIFNRIQVKF
jgi:hypothetical protein